MASLYRNAAWFLNGWTHYTRSGYERASAEFNPDALNVDMTGKTVIVSGANSGLGRQAATELAKRGATVHMLCRSEERGRAAKEEISKLISDDRLLRLHGVDVSSPAQIHAFVRGFAAKRDAVCDVLINNAGTMVQQRIVTDAGLESGFATNTFGPYCLTEWLLPRMREGSRVINVVSGGMLTQKLDLDYNCESLSPFDGTVAYARNKRQLHVLTEHWSRQHPHIRFYAPHPGWADTPGVKEAMPGFYERMQGRLRTVEQGADTIVWAACSPDALSCPSGSFLQDRKAVSPHLPLAGTRPSDAEVSQFTSELSLLAGKFSQVYSDP